MSQSPLYIIGSRGSGVLFVRTSPLRASMVSHQAILDFERQHPGVDGYARVAAAASRMTSNPGSGTRDIDPIEARGIEKLVQSGATVSDATFTFVGQIDDNDLDLNRMSTMPIQSALAALGSGHNEASQSGEDLVQTVLSDTPVELP